MNEGPTYTHVSWCAHDGINEYSRNAKITYFDFTSRIEQNIGRLISERMGGFNMFQNCTKPSSKKKLRKRIDSMDDAIWHHTGKINLPSRTATLPTISISIGPIFLYMSIREPLSINSVQMQMLGSARNAPKGWCILSGKWHNFLNKKQTGCTGKDWLWCCPRSSLARRKAESTRKEQKFEYDLGKKKKKIKDKDTN